MAADKEVINLQDVNFVKKTSSNFFKNFGNYSQSQIFSISKNKSFSKRNINIYGETNIFKITNINDTSIEERNFDNIEVNIYGEENKINIIKNFDDELIINIGDTFELTENYDIVMEYQIYNSTYKTTINSVGTGIINLFTPHGSIKINGS